MTITTSLNQPQQPHQLLQPPQMKSMSSSSLQIAQEASLLPPPPSHGQPQITTVSHFIVTNQAEGADQNSNSIQPLSNNNNGNNNSNNIKNSANNGQPLASVPSGQSSQTTPTAHQQQPVHLIQLVNQQQHHLSHHQLSASPSQVSTPVQHCTVISTSSANNPQTQVTKRKETLEAKRERKAAKTLAIITGAFVVCWLPFFITALVMPLCASCNVSDTLFSFFLWLGYFNSTLNPVIYTIFSPEFRQAFKRILFGGHRNSYYRSGKF